MWDLSGGVWRVVLVLVAAGRWWGGGTLFCSSLYGTITTTYNR